MHGLRLQVARARGEREKKDGFVHTDKKEKLDESEKTFP